MPSRLGRVACETTNEGTRNPQFQYLTPPRFSCVCQVQQEGVTTHRYTSTKVCGEKKAVYPVFERFTDRARRVVVLAQEEARLLNHSYIGTEHILLGLIHEGEGVAAKALESLNISLEAVRAQDRKSTRLNSSHSQQSRMPSSA